MAYRTTEIEGRPSEQKDQRPVSKDGSGGESLGKRENNGRGGSSVGEDSSQRLALQTGTIVTVDFC